jgi:rare lipoprotein A
MANGKPFNMHAMTAAMWGPKFGTRYRVTSGGKSVVVTITDRGPAKRLNRIIDLSYAAAKQLGMIRAGTASVCLTRL